MSKRLAPVHPGRVLREDFLAPIRLTPYAVARACGVPRTRIERLVRARILNHRSGRFLGVVQQRLGVRFLAGRFLLRGGCRRLRFRRNDAGDRKNAERETEQNANEISHKAVTVRLVLSEVNP